MNQLYKLGGVQTHNVNFGKAERWIEYRKAELLSRPKLSWPYGWLNYVQSHSQRLKNWRAK